MSKKSKDNAKAIYKLSAYFSFSVRAIYALVAGLLGCSATLGLELVVDFLVEIHHATKALVVGSFNFVHDRSWLWQNEGIRYMGNGVDSDNQASCSNKEE